MFDAFKRHKRDTPKYALGCIPDEHDDRDLYVHFLGDGKTEIYRNINGKRVHVKYTTLNGGISNDYCSGA